MRDFTRIDRVLVNLSKWTDDSLRLDLRSDMIASIKELNDLKAELNREDQKAGCGSFGAAQWT